MIKLRAQNREQGYGLWSDDHNFSTKAVAKDAGRSAGQQDGSSDG